MAKRDKKKKSNDSFTEVETEENPTPAASNEAKMKTEQVFYYLIAFRVYYAEAGRVGTSLKAKLSKPFNQPRPAPDYGIEIEILPFSRDLSWSELNGKLRSAIEEQLKLKKLKELQKAGYDPDSLVIINILPDRIAERNIPISQTRPDSTKQIIETVDVRDEDILRV